MARLTEVHEEREDHMITSEEEGGDFVSFFVVSDHLGEKCRTQVAEVWLSEYNVEVLVNDLQDWMQSRRDAELPAQNNQRGAGKPRPQ